MRVDHRRLDVRVAQVLLDLPDGHAVEQQMGRDAVPQAVDGNGLVNVRSSSGRLHGLLNDRIADVVEATVGCDNSDNLGNLRDLVPRARRQPWWTFPPGAVALPLNCCRRQ